MQKTFFTDFYYYQCYYYSFPCYYVTVDVRSVGGNEWKLRDSTIKSLSRTLKSFQIEFPSVTDADAFPFPLHQDYHHSRVLWSVPWLPFPISHFPRTFLLSDSTVYLEISFQHFPRGVSSFYLTFSIRTLLGLSFNNWSRYSWIFLRYSDDIHKIRKKLQRASEFFFFFKGLWWYFEIFNH